MPTHWLTGSLVGRGVDGGRRQRQGRHHARHEVAKSTMFLVGTSHVESLTRPPCLHTTFPLAALQGTANRSGACRVHPLETSTHSSVRKDASSNRSLMTPCKLAWHGFECGWSRLHRPQLGVSGESWKVNPPTSSIAIDGVSCASQPPKKRSDLLHLRPTFLVERVMEAN